MATDCSKELRLLTRVVSETTQHAACFHRDAGFVNAARCHALVLRFDDHSHALGT